MKFKHFFLSLLLLALVQTNCKKEDSEPPQNQITSGQGLADLKVGDLGQKAFDKYGTRIAFSNSSNGLYTHTLLYLEQGVTLYFEPTTEATFNAQMKIARITFYSPFTGQTDRKIGIGSKKSDVRAAYGEPNTSGVFGGDRYATGITFVYDFDIPDSVKSILIEKP